MNPLKTLSQIEAEEVIHQYRYECLDPKWTKYQIDEALEYALWTVQEFDSAESRHRAAVASIERATKRLATYSDEDLHRIGMKK